MLVKKCPKCGFDADEELVIAKASLAETEWCASNFPCIASTEQITQLNKRMTERISYWRDRIAGLKRWIEE